jgi:hypothetical protein
LRVHVCTFKGRSQWFKLGFEPRIFPRPRIGIGHVYFAQRRLLRNEIGHIVGIFMICLWPITYGIRSVIPVLSMVIIPIHHLLILLSSHEGFKLVLFIVDGGGEVTVVPVVFSLVDFVWTGDVVRICTVVFSPPTPLAPVAVRVDAAVVPVDAILAPRHQMVDERHQWIDLDVIIGVMM